MLPPEDISALTHFSHVTSRLVKVSKKIIDEETICKGCEITQGREENLRMDVFQLLRSVNHIPVTKQRLKMNKNKLMHTE